MGPYLQGWVYVENSAFFRSVGMAVRQDFLDVRVLPDDECFRIANTRRGLWGLISHLSDCDSTLVVMGATGGLDRLCATLLAEAGFAVAMINPRQIWDFARAIGLLAKTDRQKSVSDRRPPRRTRARNAPPPAGGGASNTTTLKAQFAFRRHVSYNGHDSFGRIGCGQGGRSGAALGQCL